MQRLSEIKSDLSELATLLNQFKSEAVQLKILELVFGSVLTKNHRSPVVEQPSPLKSASRRKRKAGNPAPAQESSKKPAAGKGALATLGGLVASGFFKEHRTIGNIIDHSKVNLARGFKANELSGPLVRMVRNGELIRQKNNDAQYEYKQP